MNKIKDFISGNYKIIVPCLIGLILFVGIFVNIRGTLSNLEEKSNKINLISNSTDFYEYEEGSWHFSKEAYLNGPNKLIVQYNLEANSGTLNKDEDVLFVINNSETAHCTKKNDDNASFAALKNTAYLDEQYGCYTLGADHNIYEASLDLLTEKANSKVAIMSYSDEYQLLTGLTNETEVIQTVFENYDRAVNKYTNYYKALEGINEFLKNYTFSNDRELRIVLLVGDVSTGRMDEEEALFKEIKQKYPNVTIYAVHNFIDNDNSKLERIKKISDYIYSYGNDSNPYGATSKKRSNTEPIPKAKKLEQLVTFHDSSIFDQLIFDKAFSILKVVDNYNSEYFNFNDFKIIYNNAGNVEYNKNNNSLTWTIDGEIIKNYSSWLIVELSVNSNNEKTNKLIPVNNNINIKSKFEGKPEEDINVPATPYVNFYNKVVVDSEAANYCDLSNLEEAYYFKVGEQVDLSNLKINCDGFDFEGWTIVNNCDTNIRLDNLLLGNNNSSGVRLSAVKINNSSNCQVTSIIDNVFVMPGRNVTIRPKLSKITIHKSVGIGEDGGLE